MLDVPTGTYNLEVKTEYTPSDDDVATFIDTIRVEEGDVSGDSLIDKNQFGEDQENYSIEGEVKIGLMLHRIIEEI